MDYDEVVAFVAAYDAGERNPPFTVEEANILHCIRYSTLPCARQKNRGLALYICRYVVDYTEEPLNQYRVANVIPVRSRLAPYCRWQILFRFVDPDRRYSKGPVARAASRHLSYVPLNSFIIGRLNEVYFDRVYWSLLLGIRQNGTATSCHCENDLTPPSGLVLNDKSIEECAYPSFITYKLTLECKLRTFWKLRKLTDRA